MPTWKVSSFEPNVLWAEMLELDYITEPSLEGKSHLRTGEENQTASEFQHLDSKLPAIFMS